MNYNIIIGSCCFFGSGGGSGGEGRYRWNRGILFCSLTQAGSTGSSGFCLVSQRNTVANFCVTTERRRLCHKGGNKELCCYASVGSSHHGRGSPVLISLINGGQVMLKDKISLYGRSEMKWAKNDGRFFSITRPFYNFKRLFFACCLFQFPPPVYKLHRGRFRRHLRRRRRRRHRRLLLFNFHFLRVEYVWKHIHSA